MELRGSLCLNGFDVGSGRLVKQSLIWVEWIFYGGFY